MKGLAGRGFGLAEGGIPAASAAKKPHRAFFKNDTPRCCGLYCVKSHLKEPIVFAFSGQVVF